MSIIPRSKHGDCSKCGRKNTSCVKNGKNLFCLDCRNEDKRNDMIGKASKREDTRKGIESESERDSLINDLDFIVSRYIRIRESDSTGKCQCYTCGKVDHWTKLQAGHFIKRAETILRWDVRNLRPQCVNCNCNLYGNIEAYESKLEEEQQGICDELRELAREVNKFTRDDLKELLINFRSKLKIVEMRFK
jgi:hypothetical protein